MGPARSLMTPCLVAWEVMQPRAVTRAFSTKSSTVAVPHTAHLTIWQEGKSRATLQGKTVSATRAGSTVFVDSLSLQALIIEGEALAGSGPQVLRTERRRPGSWQRRS
jgi:hypothetical protein